LGSGHADESFEIAPETLARLSLVHRLFSGTEKSYDFVVKLCTFGFDEWWKRKILGKMPQDPCRIVDQACGTGILTLKIARKYPLARVTGVELRREYLQIAVEQARRGRIANTDYRLGRAEEVILEGPIDCITSSYLAKYAEIGRLVYNARGMLRKDGRLILHDFTYPTGLLFPSVWRLYFRLLQMAGSRVFPEWKTAFFELPDLLQKTRWVDELIHVLQENQFGHIQVEKLTFGSSTLVTAENSVPISWP
jgi:demethylmenaquinone methyltransferase / 2-methoxy-6-polyprenyl-1,4-benzoquinol methylase